MHFVRMQCPACGAPVEVGPAQESVTCVYCRTRFAVAGRANQPALQSVAPAPPPATVAVQPSTPMTLPAPARAPASNRRGCLWALVTWFFIGPMTVALISSLAAPLLDRTAEGVVEIPDPLGFCLGLLLVGLTIYAFVHFRRTENTLWGFIAAPWRALRRAVGR